MMCSKCKEIKNVSAFQGYKTCNMCRETARKYKDKYYFCDVCGYSVGAYEKSRHLKTEYHKDRLRRKEHPEEYENEEEPCFKTKGDNDRIYFGCRFFNKTLLCSQWQKHTTSPEHLENKFKQKTLTNPNLLDNQYQLTECFLCCDE